MNRPCQTSLAIVGSRCLAESQAARRAILEAIAYWRDASPSGRIEIVTGGAVGVDSIAEAIAGALGLPLTRIEADTLALRQARGRYAQWSVYRQRNIALVRYCTHLQCVRCSVSDTHEPFWIEGEGRRQGRRVLKPIEVACAAHAARRPA